MVACYQMNIKETLNMFISLAASLKPQLYSFGMEHNVIIQSGMAEDT